MDRDSFNQYYTDINKKFSENFDNMSVKYKPPDTKIGQYFSDITEQRRRQRKALLIFIIILTSVITATFVGMIVSNGLFVAFEERQLFSDTVINIVGISFFADLIATIKIISEQLWDEKKSMESVINKL